MFKIFCVTHRGLCSDFSEQLALIAAARPDGIILREKDLDEAAYTDLARRALDICKKSGTPLVLHSFVGAALGLGAGSIHLPLRALRELGEDRKQAFAAIGASVHSPEEAAEAEALGAAYLIAGHIFETDCKQGLAGRGLGYLRQVCEAVKIPVYAIGGIGKENIAAVAAAGASGACIMSGFMKSADPQRLLNELRKQTERNNE